MTATARRAAPSARKATNVSLDSGLVQDARELGVNISRACEDGLAAQVKRLREERWRAENAEAIKAYNAWIAENGLPLARYRLF